MTTIHSMKWLPSVLVAVAMAAVGFSGPALAADPATSGQAGVGINANVNAKTNTSGAFQMSEVSAKGQQVAEEHKDGDHKCGKQHCGKKDDKQHCGKDKSGEHHCGKGEEKSGDHKCGEGTCGAHE
ncbi:MAG: hypothetical protein SFZ03_07100 [Candidatus Melainabacteria bacterium]|nr:hypothetical protein [Candidatus Melainabacteria bacterium]